MESEIRHELARAFATIDDSFVPYSMNSRSHLTVSPDRIEFIGEARNLLYLHFD